MKQQFAANQCEIDAVYYCPYHPEKALPQYLKDSDWRKPASGMLLQAIQEFDLDPGKSMMIGDRETDMQAAEAAGIGRKILLNTKVNASSDIANEVWQSLIEGIERF
jgi:D-glycero-D-manno-heptose 1,7-bisphosphate phosphatase